MAQNGKIKQNFQVDIAIIVERTEERTTNEMNGIGTTSDVEQPGRTVSDVVDGCCASVENGKLEQGTCCADQAGCHHASHHFMKSLPPAVQRRVRALKKLQLEAFEVQRKFHEANHALENEFAELFEPIYQKRRAIACGADQPTDAECELPQSVDDGKDGTPEENGDGSQLPNNGQGENGEEATGIPNFWLTVFKNAHLLSNFVQEYDQAILKHLVDVCVQLDVEEPKGFTLQFVFEPNEFFTNSVLTKQYLIQFGGNCANPLDYEGPEVVKCIGCPIDWKEGKDVTRHNEVVSKVTNGNSPGKKTPPSNKSFFDLFAISKVDSGDREMTAQTTNGENDADEVKLEEEIDFNLGNYIRESIVPRAVLYYTGDADDDQSSSDEFEDCSEDYDEDADPDYIPPEMK